MVGFGGGKEGKIVFYYFPGKYVVVKLVIVGNLDTCILTQIADVFDEYSK